LLKFIFFPEFKPDKRLEQNRGEGGGSWKPVVLLDEKMGEVRSRDISPNWKQKDVEVFPDGP